MLGQLLANGSLELRPQTIDKYGRTVAEVYAGGRKGHLELVRMGLAYAYRDYLRGSDANAYLVSRLSPSVTGRASGGGISR